MSSANLSLSENIIHSSRPFLQPCSSMPRPSMLFPVYSAPLPSPLPSQLSSLQFCYPYNFLYLTITEIRPRCNKHWAISLSRLVGAGNGRQFCTHCRCFYNFDLHENFRICENNALRIFAPSKFGFSGLIFRKRFSRLNRASHGFHHRDRFYRTL